MIELFSNWNLERKIIGFVARLKISIWVVGWMRFSSQVKNLAICLLLPFSDFFFSAASSEFFYQNRWCDVEWAFFIYNKEGIKKCLAFTRPWSTFWSHQSSFMLQIPTFLFTFLHHTQRVHNHSYSYWNASFCRLYDLMR